MNYLSKNKRKKMEMKKEILHLLILEDNSADAMSAHWPCRPALGIDKALEEIFKNRGTLYDPEVVDTCLKLFKEKGFKF